jgi:hypothetical protein
MTPALEREKIDSTRFAPRFTGPMNPGPDLGKKLPLPLSTSIRPDETVYQLPCDLVAWPRLISSRSVSTMSSRSGGIKVGVSLSGCVGRRFRRTCRSLMRTSGIRGEFALSSSSDFEPVSNFVLFASSMNDGIDSQPCKPTKRSSEGQVPLAFANCNCPPSNQRQPIPADRATQSALPPPQLPRS